MNARLDSLDTTTGHGVFDSHSAADTGRLVPVVRRSLALMASAALLGVGVARAASATPDQNWPQWRGPLCTGVAPNANPPVTWSETKNIKWKVSIAGEGTATPVIWENRVFIQTAIPSGSQSGSSAETASTPAAEKKESPPPGRGGALSTPKPTAPYQFVLICLDRQTGKTLWQQVAREEVPHEGHHPTDGNFANSSPVTDGQHVFAYFGSRGLHCYDMNGRLQWSQDLGKMRIAMGFGEGSSPTLYKDTIIVNWDNEENSFIIALDKNTGKTLWKQPRDEKTSWATPLIVEHDGKPQVVTAATGKIRSYDLATGNVVWECGGLTRNVIPSPVAADGIVYAMSGYSGNALLAIRLGRAGDLTGTDAIAWSYKKNTPYVPSPLLYGNRLYFLAVNNGVLSCLDVKLGRLLIDAMKIDALPGVYASPLGASGRVYLVGRNGATVVIRQSDTFDVLATNQLDEKFDASPAAVGKELFLRGQSHLYCIAEP
jgi:outer membrane protein assembly factor BamB